MKKSFFLAVLLVATFIFAGVTKTSAQAWTLNVSWNNCTNDDIDAYYKVAYEVFSGSNSYSYNSDQVEYPETSLSLNIVTFPQPPVFFVYIRVKVALFLSPSNEIICYGEETFGPYVYSDFTGGPISVYVPL